MLQWQVRHDRAVSHRWVPAAEIPPVVVQAVVAAEDQRFFQHHGFDLQAIDAALRERMREGRLRGASTISQQVAKNLFLWDARSWVRKALEAWLTVWIELLWPKTRILELYVNIAQFGPGIFGVGAAAELAFGHAATELSAEEAALLAAVLPSPERMRVDRPSSYVWRRQAWILAEMRRLGAPDRFRLTSARNG